MTPAELCAKYPYVPGSLPRDYPWGSPERLQGVEDPSQREMLARLYVQAEARWAKDEAAKQAREQRQREQRLQAQSREHADHWSER